MDEIMLKGKAASPGIAMGPALVYACQDLEIPCRAQDSLDQEFVRFKAAQERAVGELSALKCTLLERGCQKDQADIFDAQAAMIEDPMLEETIQLKLEQGKIVEQALYEAIEEIAGMLASLDDELLAARAMDARDIGRRLLRILTDCVDTQGLDLHEPSIIIAADLNPSDTARLDPCLVLGFCTASGGITSHTTILARTLGLPAIVAMGAPLLEQVKTGSLLVMDGSKGQLYVNPEQSTQVKSADFQRQQQIWLDQIQVDALSDTYTADGHRVEVSANIGSLESAREALPYGAEGIGLLRTEFLYLNEVNPPGENEQVKVYKEIFEQLPGKPVVVRTLDIGGDKPPSFLKFPIENNPFLGWRGIRICLEDDQLFKTQLRSILRAACGHKISIMFPMVISSEEVKAAKLMLEESKRELEAENLYYNPEVPVGIMVETPAAAILADIFAQDCDFFSLGTNDLTQYSLAVDRTNEKIGALYQPLHPAVLRMIQLTIEAGHKHGKCVGMCGELAGMLKAVPILLGLGLDEFSMAHRSIPAVKWLIRQLDMKQAKQITQLALQLHTSAEVEALMDKFLEEYSPVLQSTAYE